MSENKTTTHTLPEARGINLHLFVPNAYQDPKPGSKPGEPAYKAEMAFSAEDRDTIEELMADAMAAEFGKAAGDAFFNRDAGYFSPFLDGDELAGARAAKGKEGDAYKGKFILRMNTIYNHAGVKIAEGGSGGIAVYGPDAERIEVARQSEVFNGSYGIVAVTFKARESTDDVIENGRKRQVTSRTIKTYLKAYQMTRGEEADRLTSAQANPFKPLQRAGAAGADGGRRRRG